jgi:hypothetical protein
MLNDSWADQNPTKVVVPIEEEEDVIRFEDSLRAGPGLPRS